MLNKYINHEKRFKGIFAGIKTRCKKGGTNSRHYGDKGVKCEWNSYEEFKRDIFEEYKKHAIFNGYRNTSIDRIDSNGNYCKSNCRWATRVMQARHLTKKLDNDKL